jgi:hypothetical protein
MAEEEGLEPTCRVTPTIRFPSGAVYQFRHPSVEPTVGFEPTVFAIPTRRISCYATKACVWSPYEDSNPDTLLTTQQSCH